MEETLPLRYAVYDTAIGDVTLIANERRLVGMLFGSKDPIGAINDENTALYDGIIELNQYCYGQRKQFSLKLEPIPGDRAKKFYDEVSMIPYGKTRTIKDLALQLGLDEKEIEEFVYINPLPIFIPTHRVVVSDEEVGHLSGCDDKMYETGEDVALKKKLIEFEKANADKVFAPGH